MEKIRIEIQIVGPDDCHFSNYINNMHVQQTIPNEEPE